MRRKIVWRVVCIPSRVAKGGEPDGGDLLAVPNRHPGPWFHKVRETLGEDFPLTVGVATGEFADGQEKLDPTTRAGDITQGSAVVTMDRRRRFRTQWTARCRVRRDHRDHQASLCDLDLLNEHPFRQWQQ